MNIIDVWGNSFVPLLAGIPLLIFVLFACCACIDKTISAVRKSYYYYHYKPRTARRVRFDCETPLVHHQSSSPNVSNKSNTSTPRLSRSGTSPKLTGLMAHSSYLQRNSNYRYNSVVHTDRSAAPLHARTVLDRESGSSGTATQEVIRGGDRADIHHNIGGGNGGGGAGSSGIGASASASSNLAAGLSYHGSRRSSTPTPPGTHYYAMRPKSPFESCGAHVEPKQRRYSTPSSPTMYAYARSPRHEESNYSSISYLPEVRAYMQFMEVDPSSRQRSHSFSGRNTSRSSSRRSSRRSSRHRPRSRSPSPYALERTAMAASEEMSNYSSPSSFGRYLTPQGSSEQGSFRSPESGTPDWLLDSDRAPSFEDCLSNLSRSSSIRTSFI